MTTGSASKQRRENPPGTSPKPTCSPASTTTRRFRNDQAAPALRRALALRGRAAVAQAQLAYQLFGDQFTDKRWTELAARGAHVQRPLWASTSTKNPTYPDTLYVDNLIGPDTVNTLPETTIDAFEEHGTLARTIHTEVDEATGVLDQLAHIGVEMDDVGLTLEDQGVASFHEAFAHVLDTLATKARGVTNR